jgi:hypothetical protein
MQIRERVVTAIRTSCVAMKEFFTPEPEPTECNKHHIPYSMRPVSNYFIPLSGEFGPFDRLINLPYCPLCELEDVTTQAFRHKAKIIH